MPTKDINKDYLGLAYSKQVAYIFLYLKLN